MKIVHYRIYRITYSHSIITVQSNVTGVLLGTYMEGGEWKDEGRIPNDAKTHALKHRP